MLVRMRLARVCRLEGERASAPADVPARSTLQLLDRVPASGKFARNARHAGQAQHLPQL
eukprot:CAMPEP_0179112706 /NCGR_PEP_ID=MMETSP0796-20121207/52698_1 /TAXON_ID=73915 /ORGANISM="Pyrodinium bahamense, Strain pbaha01" /LENGTH=58 /DNA_ID=CAMNT_0020810885 /DNA_START=70 /DNA_END=242 /DNA_ORIENTATION=-